MEKKRATSHVVLSWMLLVLVGAVILFSAGIGLIFPNDGSTPNPLVGMLLLGVSLPLFIWGWTLRKRRRMARQMAVLLHAMEFVRDMKQQLDSSDDASLRALKLLRTFAPQDQADTTRFRQISLDYLGGDGSRPSDAVDAVQTPLSEAEQLNLLDMADDILRWVKREEYASKSEVPIPVHYPRPLPYLVITQFKGRMSRLASATEFEELLDPVDEELQSVRDSIAVVTKDATVALWEEGRIEDAMLVLMIAGQLYLRAEGWVFHLK